MSALPPVPNVVKLQLHYQVGDKAAANILHFAYSPFGAAPEAYVSAMATTASVANTANAGLWQPDTTFLGVTVTDLSSDTGFVVDSGADTVGTREGEVLSANVALLASYFIDRRYRGGHPRTYLPWFTNADILNPQQWVEASVGDATDAWSTFIDTLLVIGGGGYVTANQVQVSYYTGHVAREFPLVDAIFFNECDQVIASQRRRDGRH